MPAPLITNRRPNEGDQDVSATTPFRFGVRDTDTRADLSTIYCGVTFAQAVYVPADDLPSQDSRLLGAGAATRFATFDDAAGSTDPGNPCDQTIEDVGGTPAYRIEKSDLDGVPQEGFLYVTVPSEGVAQPCGASFAVDLPFVTPDPGYAYSPYADFVGVVLGLVYWPENTGVFLMFRDDGVKRIAVVGPATDGAGTRSVEQVTAYDWSSPATYSIYVDPSALGRKVLVHATGSDGTEVRLAEFDLDAMNEFLPSVRMGNVFAEDAPADRLTAVVGIDGTDQGNYIDVYGVSVANYGRVLVYAGGKTGASTVDVDPTALLAVVGSEGAAEWGTAGTVDAETTATALHVFVDDGLAAYTRDEPDLASGEWLVVVRLAAENASHPGTYSTGLGVVVADGTREVRLNLIDSFVARTVGIADSAGDGGDIPGYRLPSSDVEWESAVSMVLLGSLARDVVRLYAGDDSGADPVLDLAYTAAGYAATSESAVSFGGVDAGTYAGDFYLVHLWVLLNAVLYEPLDGGFPEAEGWSRAQSGGTRQVVDGVLDVDCSSPGSYDIYYVEDATYDSTSSAAIFVRVEVTSWRDAGGAVQPSRQEFGPVALVRAGSTAVQLRFVVTSEGVAYVFLSNEESDVEDVLAQNSAGAAISAEVDLTVPHVYLLDVRPMQHVRLHIDYATEAAIDVEWPFSGTLRALPANVPAGAVLAFGSLDEDTGVRCSFSFFRGGIGRGYDFRAGLAVPETDVSTFVYGSLASLLVDVTDED